MKDVDTDADADADPTAPPPPKRYKRRCTCDNDTSLQSRLQAGKDLLDHFGAKYTNTALFDYFGVNKRTGYRIMKQPPKPLGEETRGRKKILTDEHVDLMEQYLIREGSQRVAMPWQEVLAAAGIEFPDAKSTPSKETIRKSMNARGWYKCMACAKFCYNTDFAGQRDEVTREELDQLGLDPKNFQNLRYSDEVRVKFGPDGKVKINRSIENRYCKDCNRPKSAKDPNKSAVAEPEAGMEQQPQQHTPQQHLPQQHPPQQQHQPSVHMGYPEPPWNTSAFALNPPSHHPNQHPTASNPLDGIVRYLGK